MKKYTMRSKTRAGIHTKKQFRRGGGQGKSKPAGEATVETPSNAIQRLIGEALSKSGNVRKASTALLTLVDKRKTLQRNIPGIESSIKTLTTAISRKSGREPRLSKENKETLLSQRAQLAAKEKKLAKHKKNLANINAAFNEQNKASESAAAGVGLALEGIEGVGAHGEHVLAQRAAAAEAAAAAANKTQANILYAALPNNAARGRFLTAQRKAEEFANNKSAEAIINKYKTTIQQLTKIANTMKTNGINKPGHNALDEQFEYLNTFAVRLYEILNSEKYNIKPNNYAALGTYNATGVNLSTVPNYTPE